MHYCEGEKGSFLLCRDSRIARVSETRVETKGSRARDYLVRKDGTIETACLKYAIFCRFVLLI